MLLLCLTIRLYLTGERLPTTIALNQLSRDYTQNAIRDKVILLEFTCNVVMGLTISYELLWFYTVGCLYKTVIERFGRNQFQRNLMSKRTKQRDARTQQNWNPGDDHVVN